MSIISLNLVFVRQLRQVSNYFLFWKMDDIEFCLNRTIDGEVMASYRLFKMAAMGLEIYFQVQF